LQDIHYILKEYWGYDTFRPLQEDIIRKVLKGEDTLALLPTGGGKSVCYQVPALAKPGLCLVISPLIALMKDQVEQLNRRNITAFAVFSGQTYSQVKTVLQTASESNCKFLYISPERLETRLFREFLPGLPVNLIAVDEAHCISQWGYDFRPSYLKIAALREELPDVPLLAVTASATRRVQEDIMEKLQFRHKNIFRQSFARPNISYSAFNTTAKVNRIVQILNSVQGSGIIYCKTRRNTRELSNLLNMQGIHADFYHAGLSQEERNRKQDEWIKNKIRIIVCTNAFGMGIDKPDVRLVIHADPPDNLENYYQEAGRAGRDGKKSYAVLLYNDAEAEDLSKLPNAKFPDFKLVKQVYHALMDFLQIPVYSGAGSYYDFDFNRFIKAFNIEPNLAINALKLLEQEEFIALNDQVFLPSTAMFVCSRETLFDFEAIHTDLEPLIKALLRSYEGIYDQHVFIFEKQLAFRLRLTEDEISKKLQILDRAGIIEYEPRKESPQVYLIGNRVPENELVFNYPRVAERRAYYQERVHAMQEFISTKDCRSLFIGRYFGDNSKEPCGVCDNCLDKKRKPLTPEEFERISGMIKTILAQKAPVSPENIIHFLKPINRSSIMEVLDFLRAEEHILVNDKGEISPA
jgi:ATP-dependent DNA helicase RecQ